MPENWFKKALIWSLYMYPTVPNPPITPTIKRPAKMVPLIALSSSPDPLSLSLSLSPSSFLGFKLTSLLKLWGDLFGVFKRVCCFLVSFREEHGFKKWNLLGLKLYRNELTADFVRENWILGPCWKDGKRVTHEGVLLKSMVGISDE